jgi:hypothetical protein
MQRRRQQQRLVQIVGAKILSHEIHRKSYPPRKSIPDRLLDDLIATFGTLEAGFPDVVSVSVLADRCRKTAKKSSVKEGDVRRVLQGLQIIVPDLIQVDGDKVALTVHPNKLAEAIQKQLGAAKAIETKNDEQE